MSNCYVSLEREGDPNPVGIYPDDLRHVLNLAWMYGWHDRETDRILCTACAEITDRVSAAQARALADALERALPDIPCHDARTHKLIPAGVGGAAYPRRVFPNGAAHPRGCGWCCGWLV